MKKPLITTLSIALLAGAAGVNGCSTSVKVGSEDNPGLHPGKKGKFDARHEFTIDVPEGAKKVRAWLPKPSPNDTAQKVSNWKIDTPVDTETATDNWDNEYVYIDIDDPKPGQMTIATTFQLTREELKAELDPSKTRPHTKAELTEMKRYLEGSSESVIDENARAVAAAAVGDEENPITASRKIYDAVLDRIEYHVKDPKPDAQKTMNSTGTGSSQKCYATCTGNCTDFHSLYAAVSRAAGIPTRAVYGSFFKGPLNGLDKDQSYHCWIEFHAPNIGWVPLDVAVGDIFVEDFQANENSRPRAHLTVANGYGGPDAALVDYYFGNIEERRVVWHRGRDLVLSPKQAAKPLPWNPKGYAEVDGKSTKVGRKLTYHEAQ